jgi:hypothetical protein
MILKYTSVSIEKSENIDLNPLMAVVHVNHRLPRHQNLRFLAHLQATSRTYIWWKRVTNHLERTK